jgi:hypothetical protein
MGDYTYYKATGHGCQEDFTKFRLHRLRNFVENAVRRGDGKGREGGSDTLRAVYDPRGNLSRGKSTERVILFNPADVHKAFLGDVICSTFVVPQIGETIKREDRLFVISIHILRTR